VDGNKNVHNFVRVCSRVYTAFRTFRVHVLCTKLEAVMATFNRLPSGCWRAQVRRKGQHASRSFRLKSEAETWAVEAERAIHRGKPPNTFTVDDKTSFASLIELHIKDMAEVGKPLLRSKGLCLEKLMRDLGREKLTALTRERHDTCLQAAGSFEEGIL
jgi:hypothetical protein